MAVELAQNEEEIIVVGDKVDIVAQKGQAYRAMIEDRLDNGPFLVAVPTRRGIPMHVEQNDIIYLVFYRESGRYIAQMQVIGLERRGELRYMWLLQKTRAQRNQRREAFRLPVGFNVTIYKYSEDIEKALARGAKEETTATALEKANSKDISVTGIAIITDNEYIPDEKYILVTQLVSSSESRLVLRETLKTEPLHLNATVRRCIPWIRGSKFETGLQFFGMTRETSEEISRFVLSEQQKQMKMRRLS